MWEGTLVLLLVLSLFCLGVNLSKEVIVDIDSILLYAFYSVEKRKLNKMKEDNFEVIVFSNPIMVPSMPVLFPFTLKCATSTNEQLQQEI